MTRHPSTESSERESIIYCYVFVFWLRGFCHSPYIQEHYNKTVVFVIISSVVLKQCQTVRRRLHDAIVGAIVGAIVTATIAPTIYKRPIRIRLLLLSLA